MNSLMSLRRWSFAAELLLAVVLALCAPLFLLSQDNKENTPAPKAPSVAPAQKSAPACAKTVTEAQVKGIVAKIREFQAKQQVKANKNQTKAPEQATNRKP
jgi:hypothetical protein